MKTNKTTTSLFYAFLACTAIGIGLSFETLSNYLRDAYSVSALERGLIEFPRELPGVISIFTISTLAFLKDIRLAIIGAALCTVGIISLGVLSPSFTFMIIFLFIFSFGMHMTLPLMDSIGLSLIKNQSNVGKKLGYFKGVYTAFTMLAMLIIFIGFKTNFFSYTTKIVKPFIFSGVFFILAIIILLYINHGKKESISSDRKVEWIFRKEYKYYYTLTIMSGIQKQIMFVFGPWVLIEILNKSVSVISALFLVGTFIGIFFIPLLGKLIDKYGISKLLYADAFSFVLVYAFYGLLTSGFRNGTLAIIGIPLLLAYAIIILDKMSMQMAIIRTLYLKSILIKENDLSKTLTMGQSLDHFVTIIFASLSGFIWSKFGAEYIFFGVSALSFVNVFVAHKVGKTRIISPDLQTL